VRNELLVGHIELIHSAALRCFKLRGSKDLSC
jgi:hypothetical protein